jgi:Cof subfamily protein (haloacid dehalogenase superfamily)
MRALILDIDGTLVNSQGFMPEPVHDALVNTWDRIPIILASARSPQAIEIFLKALNVDGPFVALNGAVAFSSVRSEPVMVTPLRATARDVIGGVLHRHNIRPQAVFGYDLRNWYAWGERENIDDEARITLLSPHRAGTVDSLLGMSLLKVTLIYNDRASVKSICREIRRIAHDCCSVMISKPTYLEIVDKTVSKAVAVQQLADLLQIHEFIAVGDSANDIDLFGIAVHSYAMPHSDELVRLSADTVLAEPTAEALATLIREVAKTS